MTDNINEDQNQETEGLKDACLKFIDAQSKDILMDIPDEPEPIFIKPKPRWEFAPEKFTLEFPYND